MGYLSCKAQSAIEVSNFKNPSHNGPKQQDPEKNPIEKPIKIQHFEYNDLKAATNNFSDQKLLGRGSHGLVYKAVLSSGHLVAVKKPSRRQQPTDADEFDNEIHILSNLYSPSLVNLVGYTQQSSRNDRLLVVEFMANGTLYDVLHKNPKPPSWGRRIRLALQIAKAIQTLHCQHPPVIHRDIKSANVLIDRHYNAKLGDFGLAFRCHLDDTRLRSMPPAGTIGYLDPSYVTPENLSTKNDVFSYGILLLEIISGRKAIDIGYSPPYIVDWAIPLVKRGKLLAIYDYRIPPPKNPLVRKQLAFIGAKCVRFNRERRPSMKEIVEALDGLIKLVPLHSWDAFANPCLMVENVGHPIWLANAHLGSKLRGSEPLKDPRREFSDLGFRNNLMSLMAEPEVEFEEPKSKPATRGSSFRNTGKR